MGASAEGAQSGRLKHERQDVGRLCIAGRMWGASAKEAGGWGLMHCRHEVGCKR